MTFMPRPTLTDPTHVTLKSPQQPPLHQARCLTDNGTLAHIDLDGQVYTLRITRAGKLILTK